jgi:hypothetical protein
MECNSMKERYLLLGLVALFTLQPAYAYLDPGTGSLVWQAAIGIAFGATFLLKSYWQKVIVYSNKDQKNEKK